jgi:hypothetical protein
VKQKSTLSTVERIEQKTEERTETEKAEAGEMDT